MMDRTIVRATSLTAVALLSVLAGPTRAEAQVTGRVTLTAADFHPTASNVVFANNGNYLTASGAYVAPVRVPIGATVTRLRAFVWDNEPSGALVVELLRDRPAKGEETQLATAATTGAAASVRTFAQAAAASTPITSSDALYIFAAFPNSQLSELRLYGADVTYMLP